MDAEQRISVMQMATTICSCTGVVTVGEVIETYKKLIAALDGNDKQ